MKTQKITKKIFAIGIIVIFLSISSMSSATDKTDNFLTPKKCQEDPIYFVSGTKGLNGWYISDVIISFSYDPKYVSEIQYFLDGQWHTYVEPFTVSKEGVYLISWVWFNEIGEGNSGQPIGFKIDKTPPAIKLTRKSSGKNKVIFTATVTDAVSSVERVDFYLDDVLQQTNTEAPYQYTWTGEEKQIVYAIGYNYAGLFVKSDNQSTIPKPHFRNYNFMNIVLMLLQKIFIRFY